MREGEFLPRTGATKPVAPKVWLRVLKDRWRWLARRWTFALLGFAAGMLGVAWLNAQTIGALWVQQEQLQNLNGQLGKLRAQVQEENKAQAKAETKLASHAAQAPPMGLLHLPSNEQQGLIWLQFSQLLAQHAVQLRSLRPVPDVLAAPLASQAVAVRLHAKFDDWAAVWLAMNANGPVWSIDRLRITPQDQGVDIDAVLRVWFGQVQGRDLGPVVLFEASSGPLLEPFGALRLPRVASAVFRHASVRQVQVPFNAAALPHAPTPNRAERAPEKPKAVVLDVDMNVHAEAGGDAAVAGAPTHEPPSVLPVDPAQWPLARLRLLGVWQQAQDSYAVLAAGPHWVRVRVGHRVAGHRVEQIHPQEVHLLPSQGTVKVLGLAKASP